MPNKTEECSAYNIIVDNLLKKSDDRLKENKDALAMAATLELNKYKTLRLTDKQRLYCDLLRIKEQTIKRNEYYQLNNHLVLSENEKAKLAEIYREVATRYSEIFCQLWEETRENIEDIEILSDCLYAVNKLLPDGQKIRPQFSNVIFTTKGLCSASGNFSYCDMTNVTFIGIEFCKWDSTQLEGADFRNCIFGTGTCCSADEFELVKHIDEDSTFESLLCEIDGLTEDSQEAITYTNIAFIEEVQASRKMKDTLSRSREENKELKDQLQLLQAANKKLGQENEALKAQLLPQDANQASSSTIFSFSALN
jgi:hypothetical protein